jgi:hypothetical protein
MRTRSGVEKLGIRIPRSGPGFPTLVCPRSLYLNNVRIPDCQPAGHQDQNLHAVVESTSKVSQSRIEATSGGIQGLSRWQALR